MRGTVAVTGFWIVAFVILSLVVVVEGVFIIAILRMLGSVVARISEDDGQPAPLQPGIAVADNRYTDIAGHPFSLAGLWGQGPLLLFLVSTGCVPCRDVLREFAGMSHAANAAGWQVCVLCIGSARMTMYLIEDAGLPAGPVIAAVDGQTLVKAYGITATPTVAHIDTSGRVQEVLQPTGNPEDRRLADLVLGRAAVR